MTTHDDFELKRAFDALPREIEPPEDIWPAIRAQLKTGDRRPETGDRGAGARPVWGIQRLRIAALLTVLAMSAGTLAVMRHNAGIWELSSASLSERRFSVGDRFVSGSDSAHLTVGRIGEVEVAAGPDVRLIQASWSEHRLALSRGTIRARINAPPRLFIVETPSGTAVDLGCAYTLVVDSAGNTRLVVTAGWVEFSDRGRTSLIPAGFSAQANRGTGIGTPVADDASAALVAAVRALDGYAMANDSALGVILATARPRDAVTLWHVLSGWRGSPEQRRRVYDRLSAIVPPPTDAEFGAVYGDPMTMKLWWEKLPGTLPITPEWQQRLWTLWLRIMG